MTTALAIVAHPDDETLWMSGTILRNKDWRWTIFSLCRRTDKNRYPKFLKVCKFYNATPIISNLNDSSPKKLDINKITNKISRNLKQKHFDYIFTHNKNGEYGHQRHKEVHQAVKQMIDNKQLSCNSLNFFAYYNEKFNKELVLSDLEFKNKKNIMSEFYGFSQEAPETNEYCVNKETFMEIKQ